MVDGDHAGHVHHPPHSPTRGSTLVFYQPRPDDPDWLMAIGRFHGHLGPWVTLGAMIGHDAVERLHTPGHWLIDVVCELPPDRQKQPFTCILDGLQVTSGATMGKRNLHLEWSPQGDPRQWPVVTVRRLAGEDQPAACLRYLPRPALHEMVGRLDPQRLEALSRDIARRPITEWFDIQPCEP